MDKNQTKKTPSKAATVNLQTQDSNQGKGKGKGKAMYFPHSQGDKDHAPMKMTSHAKAGLQFSVSRVAKFMKLGKYADRISAGSPVVLAAAMQYICSEIIELAGNKAAEAKTKRIKPRHIMLAIRDDIELNKLLGKADFAQCGAVPKIYDLPKRGAKGKKGCEVNDEEMDDE
ncbi:histone h2a [Stylonychia lemnae]|uniref:Histone H2A n=1 Tax=Stylonychia lemnae TaxID=5949 RepID=A0A078ASN1_STYLE|nr:histone h2a [Stylonychia lemnae]|eukprot:CDW84212.1 histone h2a [Stylonychia lemnae]